ncbi:MAG: DUF5394 family protein [Rickettsiales bacterium]|nr:DUF5394 family protein [Rickettsiales bacterium]MCA0254865.1 DUF5394 family protein [Pseudomonadota bacterium]
MGVIDDEEQEGNLANISEANNEDQKRIAELIEKIDKEGELGELIEEVFYQTSDLNEIQSNIILLIKAYLKKKHKGKAPYDATVDEQISKDINDISSKFMVNLSANTRLDAKGNKIEHSTLSKQVQSDVKRVIKNFAIYEVYKVMNPRRIAGETAKDNFAHNMAYRGEKKAMQYEGGKEEAMKEYGSDEVAKIKKQVSSLGKSKGLER